VASQEKDCPACEGTGYHKGYHTDTPCGSDCDGTGKIPLGEVVETTSCSK